MVSSVFPFEKQANLSSASEEDMIMGQVRVRAMEGRMCRRIVSSVVDEHDAGTKYVFLCCYCHARV